jgi:TatA/E family protein of Tat protein translocase
VGFGHLPELVIVVVLALIVFGPEKVPEVASSAGKMVREFREIMNDAMHPRDAEVPDDFSSYYYESLARNGEDVPTAEPEDLPEGPLYPIDEPEAEVESSAEPPTTSEA